MAPRNICFQRRRNPFYPLKIALLIWLFLFLIFFTYRSASAGKGPYEGVVEATVLRVIDGDTLAVEIRGWPAVVGEDIGIRVYGIDTRELNDGGSSSKEAMQALIKPGDTVLLMHMRRGKFFRIVARVRFGDRYQYDWEEYTLANDLAYPYFGGKKRPIGWKPKDYTPIPAAPEPPPVDEPKEDESSFMILPCEGLECVQLDVPNHRTSECKEYELPSGASWNECDNHPMVYMNEYAITSEDLVWDPSEYGVVLRTDEDIRKLEDFMRGLQLRHNLFH